MRSIFISTDPDLLAGLRLSGIEGCLCKSDQELADKLDLYKEDSQYGIIVLTKEDQAKVSQKIEDIRSQSSSPIIVSIPGLEEALSE